MRLADDEDWLLRPVLRGLCSYAHLKDGSLSLEDVARMNAALDVQDENERRARAAQEADKGRGR